MTAKLPIYLDHHATTPLDPRVLEAMLPYLREDFGNASSASHVYGWRAEAAVEQAREELANGHRRQRRARDRLHERSSGSACTSATPEPSHVLTALGRPEALVRASLRIGIGRFNTAEEIDHAAERIRENVQLLRSTAPRKAGGGRLPSSDSQQPEAEEVGS